jgi:hypothetical protein
MTNPVYVLQMSIFNQFVVILLTYFSSTMKQWSSETIYGVDI